MSKVSPKKKNWSGGEPALSEVKRPDPKGRRPGIGGRFDS